MADDKPTLPMDTPKVLSQSTWPLHLKLIFTQPVKLPGWAVIAVAVIEFVPDWKSRIDFWLDVAKTTGGYLAMAATVVASPYFSPSLIAAGLAWIVFVGESPVGVQRHYWLRYVGWIAFTICLTVMVVTAGYGALTFYIQQQVSLLDAALQRQYAGRPIYWHLTDAQRIALGIALDQVPEEKRFSIDIQCLPDAGSRTFVEDFVQVLKDHHWKFSANCFSRLRPEVTGVLIGVTPSLKEKIANHEPTEWPENVRVLTQIIDKTQIPAEWGLFDDESKADQLFLLIGNAP